MSARDRASAKCADAPINTLEQFRARCAVVASRYAIGRIDLIEAVDTLQDFAFTRGLVEEIGQDEVQRILTATVAPMLGKEPSDEYEGLSSTFARACLAADEQQQTRSSALLSERSQHHVPPSTLAAAEFLVRLGDPERLRARLAGHSAAERDDRWLDRYNDIGALVHSASVKFGEEQGSSSAATDLRSTLRAYAPRAFSEIPRRRWLHAGHYIRQQVVMTVAPGGYGKTTLILCNTVEMSTGKGLIGPTPIEGPLRVLYWNAEDPEDEVERRIAAICIHYQIDPPLLGGYLFLGSKIGNGERLAKVERKTGEVILNKPLFAAVEQFIADNKIDCVIFDPLIAFHAVPENDNSAMEKLIKAGFEQLATAQNCCVELSQHTRKNTQGELTADDSRGASAITFAARSVRVVNRMTVAEADMPKIEPEERRHYLRVSRDKTNLAPPGKATWIHLVGVELPNGDGGLHGDNVQVATAWDYPQPFAGMSSDDMRFARDLVRNNPNFRADPRSPEWVGIPLAARLKLNPNNKGDRKRISAIIRTWVANKALAIELRRDEKRRKREFVVLGPWNDAAAAQDDVDST
jgi:hypothetical protein